MYNKIHTDFINDWIGRTGDNMELNQNTIKRIRGLIVFAVVATVAGVNYGRLLNVVGIFLKMIFPFLLGAAIAFVLNVPMRWLEAHIKKGKPCKWRRPVSMTVTIIAVTGIVVMVTIVVVPELFSTLITLQESVPNFLAGVQASLVQWFAQYPEVVNYIGQVEIDWKQIIEGIISFLSTGAGTLLNTTFSAAKSIVSGVTTFGIGFIFAIYILLQKENLGRQMTKLIRACFTKKSSDHILRTATLTERTFSSFLAGQCMEAMILGAMFFVTLTVTGLPYALLIGVLIAFTALIPIFGAFIGCVIGAFLILMVSPLQTLVFIGFFLVLQQIEGNLIYPYVVGNSVGLPSIWVLVAVTLGGSMMGITGMLIFIPLASVFYSLLREWVNERLKRRA